MKTATNLKPPSQSSESLAGQPYDLEAAISEMRTKISLMQRYFPNADLTNLRKGLADAERDLRKHQQIVEDFDREQEESQSVKQAKAMFKASLQEDLREELQKLRASYPTMSIEHLMTLLRRKKPALMAEADRVEAEQAQED
jgi:hypothetical protein